MTKKLLVIALMSFLCATYVFIGSAHAFQDYLVPNHASLGKTINVSGFFEIEINDSLDIILKVNPRLYHIHGPVKLFGYNTGDTRFYEINPGRTITASMGAPYFDDQTTNYVNMNEWLVFKIKNRAKERPEFKDGVNKLFPKPVLVFIKLGIEGDEEDLLNRNQSMCGGDTGSRLNMFDIFPHFVIDGNLIRLPSVTEKIEYAFFR
jgi:hypothetical protein